MRLISRLNPAEGVGDFWAYIRRPQPYRWPILGLSMLMTGTLLFWVLQERYYLPPERPQVTYITTFAPGRTDEEIIASNIANEARKDALAAEQAERDEIRREIYRTFGRAAGMDVEKIEREAAAERAREEAAEKARREALIGESIAEPAE
ncbi:hypothetical protein [Pelagerythrobacter rhizovicinus]|uniref:Uncharacterized protein n=1 Tax=Pelagerythrobacter rhizovicinus TaxID=2268576 RepID=A0A4Q2KMS7_9SPHN|nr:hypothetical protein [Pelagerythrobacter rhizovicinus]RXZ65570.1 hypothetical protein ETX26_02120 [Pelagerythrobacter rhizovicinus]